MNIIKENKTLFKLFDYLCDEEINNFKGFEDINLRYIDDLINHNITEDNIYEILWIADCYQYKKINELIYDIQENIKNYNIYINKYILNKDNLYNEIYTMCFELNKICCIYEDKLNDITENLIPNFKNIHGSCLIRLNTEYNSKLIKQYMLLSESKYNVTENNNKSEDQKDDDEEDEYNDDGNFEVDLADEADDNDYFNIFMNNINFCYFDSIESRLLSNKEQYIQYSLWKDLVADNKRFITDRYLNEFMILKVNNRNTICNNITISYAKYKEMKEKCDKYDAYIKRKTLI